MSAGSYDPHRTTGGGIDAEVARLEAQADLSFADELRILHQLGLPRQGTLLDIGAGSGAITRRLRAALPELTMLALDVDATLLARAAAAGAHRAVADATRLPLADRSADFVLLRYVLQHVADPATVLRECARVLRRGGRAVVVEVDGGCWGLADPTYPGLGPIHAKLADAQRRAGGDRSIGRRLTRLLAAATFDDVALHLFATTSDGRPMADFAPHLGPHRLEPLVAAGVLSLADLAVATERWNRFRADPQAWAMLVGFVASGAAR